MDYVFPIRLGTLQEPKSSLNFLLGNPLVTCSLKAWTTSFRKGSQMYEQAKYPEGIPEGIPNTKWALFTHTVGVQGRDTSLPSCHRPPLWWSHAEYIHCNFCCLLDVSPIMWQTPQYPSTKFRWKEKPMGRDLRISMGYVTQANELRGYLSHYMSDPWRATKSLRPLTPHPPPPPHIPVPILCYGSFDL